jgi:uncharacterized protein YjaG (DUF416 family)
MPLTFDAEALAETLATLSHAHRVAFCAAVCERLVPNYVRFAREERWGNPTLLREALDIVWHCALGARSGSDELRVLAERSEEAAPEPAEFESDLASAALDAANAVAASLRCCQDGDVERCIEVATYARDTVDMYVQIRESMDQDDPGLERRIADHPLMVREMGKQSSDLEMLRRAPAVDDALVRRLKGAGEGSLAESDAPRS